MNNLNIDIPAERVTLLIPVHNEAGTIEGVVRDFHKKILKKLPSTQFIVVEDGSTDGTREILNHLNAEIPFKLVSSQDRKGFTRAFIDALALVDTPLAFFSDSDGQYEPADFFLLMNALDGYDIVSGYKSARRDPWYRVIMSEGYNFLLNAVFNVNMRDIDTGFKLIRKPVIDQILKEVGSFQYCVMSEFILKAVFAGYKIKEIPVAHYPRMASPSAIFTPLKLLFIVTTVLKNVFELKWALVIRKQKTRVFL